jgi:hypothetical protein
MAHAARRDNPENGARGEQSGARLAHAGKTSGAQPATEGDSKVAHAEKESGARLAHVLIKKENEFQESLTKEEEEKNQNPPPPSSRDSVAGKLLRIWRERFCDAGNITNAKALPVFERALGLGIPASRIEVLMEQHLAKTRDRGAAPWAFLNGEICAVRRAKKAPRGALTPERRQYLKDVAQVLKERKEAAENDVTEPESSCG